MKKSKLLISVLALMGTMIVTSCDNMPFDLNQYISQQGSESTSSLDSKGSDDIITSDFTSDSTSDFSNDSTSLSNDDSSSSDVTSSSEEPTSDSSESVSSSTTSSTMSSDTSSSSEDPTPVIPTEFKAKAKYYYDQFGLNQKAYFTENGEYIAFEDENTSIYLGTYVDDTNTFSDDSSEKYRFALLNDGHLILMNANDNVDDPSDDVIYSLLEETGISETINANQYDPYYYFEINDDEGKLLSKKAAGSPYFELDKKYRNIYQSAIPSCIVNQIYLLNGDVTLPTSIFGKEIQCVSSIASAWYESTSINSITVLEGVTKIDDSAFAFCSNLTSINLPQSIKEIGATAFKSSTSLTEITLPDNIQNFNLAFLNNSSLTKIILSSRECDTFINIPAASIADKTLEFIKNSDTKYNTIEEAFLKESYVNVLYDLVSKGDDLNARTFSLESEELPQGKTLAFPITNVGVKPVIRNINSSSANEQAYVESNLYSQLKLTSDLHVYGTIQIAAMVNSTNQPVQGHITGKFAQIDLNGHTLTIEDGGRIECNGKIIDSSLEKKGKIDVKSGGTIISNFIVDDFFGGSHCAERYFGNVTPFNKYRMSYIEPSTTIHYGAKYQGYCVLYASRTHNETMQNIIGEGGLFELEDQDAYIVKSVDGTSRNEIIETHGNVKTNVMSIDISGINISTEKILFPLPRHYTINICDGTFTLDTKLKVLPGAEVNVLEDATLKLNSQVIVYDEFWDYNNPSEYEEHYVCGEGEGKQNTHQKSAHNFPYYDSNADCTLVKDGHDNPGKVTINGNVIFGESKDLTLAGDIHTDEANLSRVQKLFEDVKDRVSFALDSNEGIGKSMTTFERCFTISKTSLNIYVDTVLKVSLTNS